VKDIQKNGFDLSAINPNEEAQIKYKKPKEILENILVTEDNIETLLQNIQKELKN